MKRAPTQNYAVRQFASDDRCLYLMVDPTTQNLALENSFAESYRTPPATFSIKRARQLAHVWATRQPEAEWGVEPAPNPCPRCHREIFANDRDFAYPVGRDPKRWTAACQVHCFGCGYEVEADSFHAVMAMWNGLRPAVVTEEPEPEHLQEVRRSPANNPTA